MVWFRVDDGFPTSRKVLRIPRARRVGAVGVWTLAGAWAAGELTDGFIPSYAIGEIPNAERYVPDLVSSGLWHEVDGGWTYHDWHDYQPKRDEVLASRADNAARQKAYRERKAAERNAERNALRNALVTQSVTEVVTPSVTAPRPDPTRPVPSQTVVPTELPRERPARATRIPDPFKITETMREWANTELPGIDIDRSTVRFVDYWRGKSGANATKADWPATWRNWLRRDHDQTPQRNGTPNGMSTGDQRVAGGLDLARRLAAREQATTPNLMEIER